MTLNRVYSQSPSSIDGMLTANGQVIIANQNRIIFGNHSFVDVGGLIASFSDIKNDDFLNGIMNFNIPGNDRAQIINRGNVKAHDNGKVVLLAPYVENSGNITANLGNVSLKSGEKFLFYL